MSSIPELTVTERVQAGLLGESTFSFDLAAWEDGNSREWHAVAELSETDAVSAGNIIDMWRTVARPHGRVWKIR